MNVFENNSTAFKAAFNKGVSLAKNSIQIDRLKLGSVGFFEKRRLRKALRYFHEASVLDPNSGEALLLIAKIHQRLGAHDSCLEWLKKAYRIAPENLILAIEISATLGRLGKHKEAATILEEVVRTYPNEPRTQCNLGLSYLMAGKVVNAVEAFNLLVKIEPDYPVNQKLLDLAKDVKSGTKSIPKSEVEISRMI